MPNNLSGYTSALVDARLAIKSPDEPDDYSRISVSRTVSFLATLYERVRSIIDYQDVLKDHRTAIERIVRRRLFLNKSGKKEGEFLIRELLWSKFYPGRSFGDEDAAEIQKLIDVFIPFKNNLLLNNPKSTLYLENWLYGLLTCLIDENLNAQHYKKRDLESFYIFQTLVKRVKIIDSTEDQSDILFMQAIHRAYENADKTFLRYKTLQIFMKPLTSYSPSELENIVHKFPELTRKIDGLLQLGASEKIAHFVRKQLPPYKIMFDIIDETQEKTKHILRSDSELVPLVETLTDNEYKKSRNLIHQYLVRCSLYLISLRIFIFFIVDFPFSIFFNQKLLTVYSFLDAGIPLVFLLVIVLTIQLPGKKNTHRIIDRIQQLGYFDPAKVVKQKLFNKKGTEQTSLLKLLFQSISYLASFFTTLAFFYYLLIASVPVQNAFILFIFLCLSVYYAYRIREVILEFRYTDKDSFIKPLVLFVMIPIISTGKYLHKLIAESNVFAFIIDVVIETPSKIVFNVIEEWIAYLRHRRDEIV